MKRIIFLLFLPFFSDAQIIVSIAGNGMPGYGGDDSLAIRSKLNVPDMFTLDKNDDIYFGDAVNNRIRKISASTGIITTIAGVGTGGYSGDNGPATNAQLDFPDAFVFDSVGNLYFGDAKNFCVRKIDMKTGIITTIAGTGVSGDNGNAVAATAAQIGGVIGMCTDKHGNLFLADYDAKRVRKIDISTGIISSYAGIGIGGYSGDGGPATSAQIDGASVFTDDQDNIYIADEWNHRVRRVDASSGIITTITGNGHLAHPATAA